MLGWAGRGEGPRPGAGARLAAMARVSYRRGQAPNEARWSSPRATVRRGRVQAQRAVISSAICIIRLLPAGQGELEK